MAQQQDRTLGNLNGLASLFKNFLPNSSGGWSGMSNLGNGAATSPLGQELGLSYTVPALPEGVAGPVGGVGLTPAGSSLVGGLNYAPWGIGGSLIATAADLPANQEPLVNMGMQTLGSIGGGMAGAAAGAGAGTLMGMEAGSVLGPIGAVAGAILGTVAGSLFGPHPTVGPNATASYSGFKDGAPTIVAQGDNGGDAAPAQGLLQGDYSALDKLIKNYGGTIGNVAPGSAGYWKGQYFYTDQPSGRGSTPAMDYQHNRFGDVNGQLGSYLQSQLSRATTDPAQADQHLLLSGVSADDLAKLQGMSADQLVSSLGGLLNDPAAGQTQKTPVGGFPVGYQTQPYRGDLNQYGFGPAHQWFGQAGQAAQPQQPATQPAPTNYGQGPARNWFTGAQPQGLLG